jgi:hypothetical protein
MKNTTNKTECTDPKCGEWYICDTCAPKCENCGHPDYWHIEYISYCDDYCPCEKFIAEPTGVLAWKNKNHD